MIESVGWNIERFLDEYSQWKSNHDTETIDDNYSDRLQYGVRYVNSRLCVKSLKKEHELKFIKEISNRLEPVVVFKTGTGEFDLVFGKNTFSKTKLSLFAKGSYGQVYKCILKNTNSTSRSVCKLIKKSVFDIHKISALIVEGFIQSLICFDPLSRVNKILYIAYEKTSYNVPFIFSELGDGTADVIEKKSLINLLLLQMASALEYLQDKYKFVHGDLKLKNIIFKRTNPTIEHFNNISINNNGYQFLMIDFGISRMVFNDTILTTNIFYSITDFNKLFFPNSTDLALLLFSIYMTYSNLYRSEIKTLLTFPHELLSLTDVYDNMQTKDIIPFYLVCAECHNPKTVPNAILNFMSKLLLN